LFYGAGAVEGFVTDEVWSRDVRIANANVANGVSVAEYTVAQIVLCLKQAWRHASAVRDARAFAPARMRVAGAYGSTVGIVSLGAIGRMVAERLRGFDVRVIAHDPFTTPEQARALNVTLAPLDEVFARADVITCHTPWLPETEGLLGGAQFRAMKPGASFINTARGAVVNEPELIAVLRERPDLFAVLDVTWPEPPAPDSPLYTLPNVMLTPHIAGSMNDECRRMGRAMVDELDRWQRGQPLRYQVSRQYARGRG
jgi:phosphoglycerate dehydrogenase-like enzyme